MLMRSLDTFLPIENRGLMHTHVYKYTGHKVYMCTRIYSTRVYKCVCVDFMFSIIILNYSVFNFLLSPQIY